MPKAVREKWWWAIVAAAVLTSLGWAAVEIRENTTGIAANRERIKSTDRVLELIRQENAESHRQILDQIQQARSQP